MSTGKRNRELSGQEIQQSETEYKESDRMVGGSTLAVRLVGGDEAIPYPRLHGDQTEGIRAHLVESDKC